jgi:hypothetical protein
MIFTKFMDFIKSVVAVIRITFMMLTIFFIKQFLINRENGLVYKH